MVNLFRNILDIIQCASRNYQAISEGKQYLNLLKFIHTLREGENFSIWAQGRYLSNRKFLKNVLFTDKVTFTRNGVIAIAIVQR